MQSRKAFFSSSFFLGNVVVPVARVNCFTINVLFNAVSVLHPVFPLAFVGATVGMLHLSVSVSLIISEVPFIR